MRIPTAYRPGTQPQQPTRNRDAPKKELDAVLAFTKCTEFKRLRNRVLTHNDQATRTGLDSFPDFPMDRFSRAVADAADCGRFCLAAELDNKGVALESDMWNPRLSNPHLRNQAERVREALIGIAGD